MNTTTTCTISAATLLADLWRDAAMPAAALARISLGGSEPALPSSFALGTLLQASLGAAALAATEVGAPGGANAEHVALEMADAVRESACRFRLDGQAPLLWDKLSGLYRCRDGWVRVHANFAHHRDGALQLLGLPTGPDTERDAVTAALRGWPALAFEDAAAERGLVVAALRSTAQWREHPQAAAVAAQPLVDIQRIADAPPRQTWPRADDDRPLAGLRVLDLTRILAGPVAGRTLAAYGADVLLLNSPRLPNIEAIAETSRGKFSAHLDLQQDADRATLRALVRDADIFLQGYRPGGLDALGFGPAAVVQQSPGIVYVALSAYGGTGPWAARRGFDSLVQTATGLNVAEAEAFGSAEPRALPLQALDYGAGFLLAFGALAALHRQRREGGSWQVQVSLAGVSHRLQQLGRVSDGVRAAPLSFDGLMESSASGFGRLDAVRHAVRLSRSATSWVRPSMPPGSHAPRWPDRRSH